MALFGRDRLPARSTLSRFLAALTAEPVEALRALFLSDLLARLLDTEGQAEGLWDRQGIRWVVFDVDGTREAARQRALPKLQIGPRPNAACVPCVLLATQDASAEKSSAPARPFCRPIPTNGSAPLATQGTASTE